MSELKMQRSGKVLHSHESPSFELKKKKGTQTGSFTSCPGAHDSFHCTKLFQQFLAFGKQPLFLFRGQIPASPGTPGAPKRRRRWPGVEMSWGGCCSPGCTCILRRNLRYIVIIYSIFESFKAISSKKLGNITCPTPHLNKRAGFFLLSAFWAYGKYINLEKKIVEIENPTDKAQFWLYLFKGKIGYTCFARILATKATKLALVFFISVLW